MGNNIKPTEVEFSLLKNDSYEKLFTLNEKDNEKKCFYVKISYSSYSKKYSVHFNKKDIISKDGYVMFQELPFDGYMRTLNSVSRKSMKGIKEAIKMYNEEVLSDFMVNKLNGHFDLDFAIDDFKLVI